MKRRYTTFPTAVMALFLLGTSAVAQEHDGPGSRHGKFHGGPRGFGGPEQMLQMMNRHLELDEIQSQQVESIIAAARPELDALREKRRTNRDAMRSLDVDDPDYGAQLENLSAENGELASDASRLFGRIRADIHAVLTPEQRQKLEESADRMHERGARGREGAGPRRDRQR